MNDTQQSPPPAGPADEFDPHRLRSISDMQRTVDDRMIAGVCAGAARYLRVDPVVVRIVIAVLTIAGFAGVILYVAAWLLIPAEDEEKSLVADWFRIDTNEEQVRNVGLVTAAILAAASIVGDSSWAWWGGAPWWILPFALLFFVFWVRPRRRREARERSAAMPTPAHTPTPATGAGAEFTETRRIDITQQKLKKSREPRSPALLGLTASLAAIALAAMWIYEETQKDVDWTTYIAVALAVVGVGLLIGTFFGNGGPLIAIGILLAITLAIGSVFPDGRIGAQEPTPTSAAEVKTHYRHGIGLLELDLTEVSNPDDLLGRRITINAGVGQTKVIVPDGLNVRVTADLKAGEVSLFDRKDNGTDVSLETGGPPSTTALSIEIDQTLGNIEVISR